MSFTDDELLQGIRAVARDHLAYSGEIQPDTRIAEALKLDSLRLLTLVVELENRFQVNLEPGDDDGLVTAADLVAVLRRRLG